MRWIALTFSLFFFCPAPACDDPNEDYEITLEDASPLPGGEFTIKVSLSSEGDDIQGFQWSVCHDSDVLSLEEGDVERTAFAEMLDTTFDGINYHDDEGWDCGMLLVPLVDELEAGDYDLYRATYQTADDLELESYQLTTDVDFCGLGDLEVYPAVIVNSADETPVCNNGTITIGWPLHFLRGDVDGNGEVEGLLDALYLLEWGFLSGDEPPCMDAADLDDSGTVATLLDAIALLQWFFGSGAEPPAPGPEVCGVDPTEDDLGCETLPADPELVDFEVIASGELGDHSFPLSGDLEEQTTVVRDLETWEDLGADELAEVDFDEDMVIFMVREANSTDHFIHVNDLVRECGQFTLYASKGEPDVCASGDVVTQVYEFIVLSAQEGELLLIEKLVSSCP